jgi:hypothetical protein
MGKKMFPIDPSNIKFDLNGGYIILGTEDVTEEKCGDLGNISYTFNQLLAALRFRGIQFDGAFPRNPNESDFAYRQNYIGTLREVLQQWCSDLGLDFYCEGKRMVGINVSKALDIQKITEIADPTTELGANFALNTNTAIISYRESNTISNSYRQSIITANTQPRQTKIHSKTPKRNVGFLPLHPIDFNIPSTRRVVRTDLFGNTYSDLAWANSFEPGSSDLNRILYQLDRRTFADVDTCIALTRFDSDLRDIYCQDRAIYGESASIRAANFRALGIIPLIEITNAYDKSTAIEAAFSSSAGDEVSNLCLDERYYKVFIGYSYPKFKEDVVGWEQASADSMYRYGALTKGLLQGLPYVPVNNLLNQSPSAGLYGSYGTSLTRIQHTFEPDARQYYELYSAPFKDIILYSGLKNRGDYFPEQLYISELANDWGTTQEQFKRDLSLRLDDACVDEYQSDASYTQLTNDIEKKFQDWKLSMFKPQTIHNLDSFFEQYLPALSKLGSATTLDRTVQSYYDINFVRSNTCAKLHIIVLTDTRTHPNIYVNFNKRGREFINPVVLQKYRDKQIEALKRRAATKIPSICDRTLLQEMCDGIIIASGNVYAADPRFACGTELEAEYYEEGFDLSYLSQANSRGLDIRIVKNPTRNTDTDALQKLYRGADINGAFYYTDTVVGDNSYQTKQAALTIIYPISVDAEDNIHYKGILSSDVEVENRTPETVEIFGEPCNLTNNKSAGIKIINNTIDPDLQPQLDPIQNKFISYLTVATGDNQVITTVSGYHDYIKKLNNYEVTGVTKSIDLSLAGTPDFFGSFSGYLSPIYGLNRMSISVTDNGVVTNLTYSDRPPQPPKQESILNKIGPRII